MNLNFLSLWQQPVTTWRNWRNWRTIACGER
jgi:hypothetical protein